MTATGQPADIRAFLFDMDGTLIDTEILWVEATRRFFAERNMPATDEETMTIVYGRAWPDVYREVVDRFPHFEMTIDEMDAALRPDFRRLREERDVRIHSSIALLRQLAEDYPVAIVSGSQRIDVDEGIALMGVGPQLAFSLSAEDYRAGKPDPSGYLAAAERLELEPEQCLVFEDSTAGIRSAKAAGMYCVALRRPNAVDQDLSDCDEAHEDLAAFTLPT